jgi:hypothetical protein
MGFCRIFFLDLPFWRFFGNDDLFFVFWSSRPILSDLRGFRFAAVVLLQRRFTSGFFAPSKFLDPTLAYR